MTDYPRPSAFPMGARFTDGIWTQALSGLDATRGRPALFLDRDGVVVEEAHYLHEPEKVRLTPRAAETVKAANARGLPVILVTNQAGVGYGYFGWDDFVAVQTRILDDLAEGGAHVDGVFACPFHSKGQGVYAHPDHPARKPNPGMLELARDVMGVDLARSWIVGDRALDMEAGRNGGLEGGVHVLTGHGSRDGERDAALAVAADGFAIHAAANLGEALDLIPLLK
ncbi:MAG: HAD family hydrolase [Alphaproteobacteria bacterium]|nr:HAD family hydrolase [Alphaproteobacteria bacterium]MBF0250037.1 HAD family hydrolase [Alphaproteobacteria bacterium]